MRGARSAPAPRAREERRDHDLQRARSPAHATSVQRSRRRVPGPRPRWRADRGAREQATRSRRPRGRDPRAERCRTSESHSAGSRQQPAAASLSPRSDRPSCRKRRQGQRTAAQVSPIRTTGTRAALAEEDRRGLVQLRVDELRTESASASPRDDVRCRAARHCPKSRASPRRRREAAGVPASGVVRRASPRGTWRGSSCATRTGALRRSRSRAGMPMPPRGTWPERVGRLVSVRRRLGASGAPRTDDDRRNRRPFLWVAEAEVRAHLGRVERSLGIRIVGAAGNAGVDRDPARGARPNHLDDHHAVCGSALYGRSASRRGDLDGGLEAEP